MQSSTDTLPLKDFVSCDIHVDCSHEKRAHLLVPRHLLEAVLAGDDLGVGGLVDGLAAVGGREDGVGAEDGAAAEVEVVIDVLPAHLAVEIAMG